MEILMNPDGDYVREIKEKLKLNGGYCPCQLIKSDDTRCICKDFREMIKQGRPCSCHCGLYIITE